MFKERHITQVYTDSFTKFLSCTDEKVILLGEIGKRIENNNSYSLLDIGAGNGDLAIPVSKMVKRYLAIEQKPDYVKKLCGSGLEVIETTFPHKLEEKFDFILASHSLPWKEIEYKPYIISAIELLNNGGKFLGITFDDENAEWNDLLKICNAEINSTRKFRLKNMEDWLASSYPLFKQTVIVTYIRTDNLDDMIEALAFLYSDGDSEKISYFLDNIDISNYLEQTYKNKKGYYFPFNHIFLEVGKNG